eukprot:m.244881 g.244881  ORF g.244881 m.244881 type:complete len:246 (+) comp15846_c0_seq1:206-943(+)
MVVKTQDRARMSRPKGVEATGVSEPSRYKFPCVSYRSASCAILIMLIALDVCIPPASLPTDVHSRDTWGANPALQFIWSLSFSMQILVSAMFTCFGLAVWRAMCGDEWAKGEVAQTGDWQDEWHMAGFVVALLGFGLRRWAKWSLARHFTYQITVPHTLVVTGPYQWWLHPGYAGSIAHAVGIVILLLATFQRRRRLAGMSAFTAALISGLSVRIREEEALLRDNFGQEWESYAENRWRLIPFVW